MPGVSWCSQTSSCDPNTKDTCYTSPSVQQPLHNTDVWIGCCQMKPCLKSILGSVGKQWMWAERLEAQSDRNPVMKHNSVERRSSEAMKHCSCGTSKRAPERQSGRRIREKKKWRWGVIKLNFKRVLCNILAPITKHFIWTLVTLVMYGNKMWSYHLTQS